MAELTRDKIVKASRSFKMKRVETPSWGDGYVYVRALRASQAGDVQRIAQEQEKGTLDDIGGLARWCILGVCDAEGNPLFTDADMYMLLNGPLVAVQDCALAVMELNGLTLGQQNGQEKKRLRADRTVRIPTRKGTGGSGRRRNARKHSA